MAPVQVCLLPINDELVPYANQVQAELVGHGLRVEVDSRTESLNKKIREAQLAQIPLTLTVGQKEKDAGTLAVRTLDGAVKHGVTHQEFVSRAMDNIRERRLELSLF